MPTPNKLLLSLSLSLSLSLGILLLAFNPFVFAEESITITTYYPSPYGSYNELRTYSNTYLATAGGNVGIGTVIPGAKLDVAGQVKITGGSPGANKVLTSDANGLASWEAGGGWYVPTSVITTTATHDGNFGSYQAIYNWIQTNGCSGYHVCDNTELSRYYQTHAPTDITGWYNTGLYAPYVYGGTESYSLCDCHGWTVNSGNPLSGYWAVSMPAEAWCYSSNKVVCCK